MNEKFPQLFWGMLVLTLGLVGMGLIVGKAIRDAKRSNDVITVTGSARKTVRSDLAVWSGSVHSSAMTREEAYQILLGHRDRVLKYLHSRHVADSALTIGGVRSDEIRDRKRTKDGGMEEEFKGFHLWLKFDVTSPEVDSIDAISKDITQLIGEGMPISSDPPQYHYTKLSTLRVSLLADATMDARTRAENIASSAGGKVRAIRTAKQGVFQVTAPNSREVSDYGNYDTSTIDKDITAVVSASFSVE